MEKRNLFEEFLKSGSPWFCGTPVIFDTFCR